jgi:hypothetical protein
MSSSVRAEFMSRPGRHVNQQPQQHGQHRDKVKNLNQPTNTLSLLFYFFFKITQNLIRNYVCVCVCVNDVTTLREVLRNKIESYGWHSSFFLS